MIKNSPIRTDSSSNSKCVDIPSVFQVNANFGFRKANYEDFHRGMDLADRLIGQGLADRDVIWAVDQHTTITAWVTGDPITGIHLMVPLTGLGTQAVRSGDFQPSNPDLDHCTRPDTRCDGVYVGAYAGTTKEARRSILQGAAFIRVTCFGSVPCFARAATEDGARSMRSLGFAPISKEPGALWVQEAIETKTVES